MLESVRELITGKAVPLTGREGPWCCETSRFSHFLDNRLTNGGEVVSLTRREVITEGENNTNFIIWIFVIIIGTIKSRKIRLVEYVAHVGEIKY
jgi:hypothetical protein